MRTLSIRSLLRPFTLFALLLGLVCLPLHPALGQARQRPIEDFVAAQGTFDNSFADPIPDFIGWIDGDFTYLASVDYAGLADAWITVESGGDVTFNTSFHGKVTERPLKDGRTEVQVDLRTTNALAWVFVIEDFFDAGFDFFATPLVFGTSAFEVFDDGATPTLGESVLKLKFIHGEPVGGALPDFLQLAFAPTQDQELISSIFQANIQGELREHFGVPEGTSGQLNVHQVGLDRLAVKFGVDFFFPAEVVTLRVLRRR